MKYSVFVFLVCSIPGTTVLAASGSAVENLLENYRQQGAQVFDAKAGEQLWHQSFKDKKSGKMRNCTSCHTSDLRQQGKHERTGKPIDAMAPSVNAKRLTDIKKIKKWLKRNCKWTLGRECTAQEKGNILRYLEMQ